VERPARRLRLKADRIEEAAGRVLELHRRGASEREIARRVFRPGGGTRDMLLTALTTGEFSRRNFVRTCLHRASSGPARDRPRASAG
jgi:hypothetical protein